MTSPVHFGRIYGTIYGNCIGDAIGLLTEFMTKKEARKKYGKIPGLEYTHKVEDSHRSNWKTGDWTDDSDQMILMMLSILDKEGEVNPVDYAKKILNWARYGFRELGDTGGNGLGATTLHVLRNEFFERNPHLAAETAWREMGCTAAPNGAVMRTSLMGIYQYDNFDKVRENTLEFCKVTHYDCRCQASCVAVTRALALMLQGKHKKSETEFDIEAIIDDSFEHAKECIPKDKPKYIEDLKFHMYATSIEDLHLDEYHKIGYTYKTLGAGFWALKQAEFRPALEKIVMEAGDADTNGAVAGALLGCKLGEKGLPETWLKGLLHKEWLDKIIKRFLDLAFPPIPVPSPKQEFGPGEDGRPSTTREDSPKSATQETSAAKQHDDEKQKSQNTSREVGHGHGRGNSKLQADSDPTGAEKKHVDPKKPPGDKEASQYPPVRPPYGTHY